jgi:hypothetical protein
MEERTGQPDAISERPWYSVVGDWLTNNVPVVLTLLGALAYAGLRLAFVSFYKHFGVTPEDVGYDYASVLTTALPGFAVVIVAAALLGLAYFLTFNLVGRRMESVPRPSWSRRLRLLWGVALPVGLAIEVALLVGIAVPGLGQRGQRGQSISGYRLFGVSMLPWSVRPASIALATKDAQTQLGQLRKACVMYLGTNSATYVLYDVITRTTVRVPVAAASVRIGEFADGCEAQVRRRH